jgi:hypothetical protein
LVPYVEGPKRGPNGSRNPLLSCANTTEAQGHLDGGARTCARWSVSAASYIYRPLR